MRRIRPYIYLPLAFAIVLALGIFLGSHMIFPEDTKKSLFRTHSGSFEHMVDMLNLIRQDYVDTISTETIEDKVIKNVLKELDPHSHYIPASMFDEMNDPLEGKFEGIGIQFRMVKDTVIVIQVIPEGPSEKAGLLPGDRIVKVNGKTVAGKDMPTDSIVGMLKGERKTEVEVSVYRKGSPDLLNFTITRDEIPTYSVDAAYMENDNTGYIKLNKFSATTSKELNNALEKLLQKGMKNLILDLRGNGGGYLGESVYVADEFLKNNELIVYTKGKNRPRKEKRATSRGKFKNGNLVVLIDELSASASEIVAGAVQDNGRGTIIGRRSFGKGLVQEQIKLKNGSAIRLTVARYYTPAGRSIQKPYSNTNDEDYYRELINRFENGEDNKNDTVQFDESEIFLTSDGDTVYGGGGIYPDIYVPFKKGIPNQLALKLIRTGMMFRFAFEYVDHNRNAFEAYENAEDFINNYKITPAVMEQFKSFARKNGVQGSKEQYQKANTLIQTRLKAFIGRSLFDNEAFFPVINTIDPEFQKAMDYLVSVH